MLLEEFLNPMSLTQRELAYAIHVPYQRINDIVHGRRSMTPSTALRLAKFFNLPSDFWMNLQMRWDMYHAQQEDMVILKKTSQYVRLKSTADQDFRHWSTFNGDFVFYASDLLLL